MGPTFCHQCRNKSDRDKMKCTSKRPDGYACGKLFCDRCVLNRYPEIDFDSSLNEWTCPHCLNICNCSHCAPRRGEKYISARGGGFAGAPTKNHVVLVPDKPAPSGAASAPPGSSHTKTFWATVYGLSGERVGQAFLGADSQLSIPRIPNTKPTIKPKRRRVFIGEPQPSWGVKAIKYLHNTHDDVSNERLAAVSRGNSVGGRQIRIYIGDRAALHEPFRRISDLDCDLSPLTSRSSSPDSDGTLTPLSELEAEIESWPQPDVGESCDWVPPPPTNIKQCVRGLSEEQVAKAIHDALAAVI
ncbi:hypothetical protein BJ138DRAFT_1013111 [Hygrophoropsis aurantiaca]|uniref:Uncharacterized protein n=1 Tax=Hygrophoropsis aurantiaca TaxID=72124 RepID=A0ACB8A6I6_9AGAM|nr:hypothetical protein BJ138DRAFT_1013111 [Hygrophoropsis aurantiaca]